jgi:hypothetical protein
MAATFGTLDEQYRRGFRFQVGGFGVHSLNALRAHSALYAIARRTRTSFSHAIRSKSGNDQRSSSTQHRALMISRWQLVEHQ